MKIDPVNLDRQEAHELLVGAIIPRPIAFVSTVGPDGVFDVAPFSSLAQLAVQPMLVGFSTTWKRDLQKKRTLRNIELSREFVLNLVTYDMAKAMNQTAADYPDHIDKFKEVGLTPIKADRVKPPMVAESPVTLECKALQFLEFGDVRPTTIIIGQVLLAHVKDEYWVNGEISMPRLKSVIGRMGAKFYCRTSDLFEMERPIPFV